MINPSPEQEARWAQEAAAGLLLHMLADPALANGCIHRATIDRKTERAASLIEMLATYCAENPEAGRAYLDRWDRITPRERRGTPDPNYAPTVRARARALWAQNGHQTKTAYPES